MKIIYDGKMQEHAFKDVIGSTIASLSAEDPDVIFLDADLMNCSGTYKWAQENPTKAFNCGIAEADMIGIACGLAAEGFKPFVHTFGPFASRRCFDQVFLSAGYAKNDITVIGTDPGICATFNGGTHMPFEDMGLYREIPTATVMDIADEIQLVSVMRQCKDLAGVKYIRVGRKKNARVYANGEETPIGKGIVLKNGADASILACGIMVSEALEAAKELENEGIHASVTDLFTVKPLDAELVIEQAKKTGAIVTAENHNKIGGLFSAVTECLASNCPVPVEYVAVEDEYGEVGPQDYLRTRFDLTSEHICRQVKKVIQRKHNG